MIIPKALTVGFTRYAVVQPPKLRYGHSGYCDYKLATISIAKQGTHSGLPYTPIERTDTFWHELTHAILHDMAHPLRNNETFVTSFSKRLSKAIRTAEL